MARTRILDFLQSHFFWAFDASNQGFPVFNPLFGFSKISAPQITAELETFKDGTYHFSRHVAKHGGVGTVTFERAASMFDSDFYDWIMLTIQGDNGFDDSERLSKILSAGRTSPRRNLLIVQFSNINIGSIDERNDRDQRSRDGGNIAAGLAGAALLGSLVALGGVAVGAAGAAGLAGATVGPFAFASRLPARAWLLSNCLPVRYKSSTDFDASSASMSLQELEVQPESISEYSLGIKP